MIHAKTPIVRLSPFFLLALLFPFFSFRFVSFCRSGQPPPLVPRTKFLSFSVDLCIFIFRRHPSFFFLLLSLFSTLTPASPYSSSLQHGDFLPLNKHLDDCFTFALKIYLHLYLERLRQYRSGHLVAQPQPPPPCTLAPTTLEAAAAAATSKAASAVIAPYVPPPSNYHCISNLSTVTQPTTTSHNGIPVCSEPGRIPPPRSDDHLRPARGPRQVQPGVNRPKPPQNSTSMHYQ